MNYTNATNAFHSDLMIVDCVNIYHYVPLKTKYTMIIYGAIIFTAILIIPTIIMNSVVVYIMCKTKSFHTPPNVLLISTALCDVLSSILGAPQWLGVWYMGLHREQNCALFIFAVYTSHIFTYMTFLLVSFMSIDRYIAIFKPYFYAHHISHNLQVYIRYVLLLLVIVTLINSLSFLTKNKKMIEFTVLISMPGLIMHSMYVHLKVQCRVKEVRNKISALKLKKHNVLQIPASPSMILSTSVISIVSISSMRKDLKKMPEDRDRSASVTSGKRLQTQVKISRLTLLLLASLYVCYTPYMIIVTLKWVLPRVYQTDVLHVSYIWSYAILCLKSFLNPFIYCYRSTTLREKLSDMFHGRSGAESRTPEMTP